MAAPGAGHGFPGGADAGGGEAGDGAARSRRWVLHTACQQASRWRRDGFDLWLSLNVSLAQVIDGEFVAGGGGGVECPPDPAGAAGGRDLRGGSRGGHRRLARALGRLRALGVRTGLDDFHGGRTTLDQLRRLRLDSPQDPLPASGEARPAAGRRVDVARRLGLEVVAEGVEDQDAAAAVRDAGCRLRPGYLFSPRPPRRSGSRRTSTVSGPRRGSDGPLGARRQGHRVARRAARGPRRRSGPGPPRPP